MLSVGACNGLIENLLVADSPDGASLEMRAEVGLGLGIERGGRLVEYDQGRVAHESPRDGDALPLAAG